MVPQANIKDEPNTIIQRLTKGPLVSLRRRKKKNVTIIEKRKHKALEEAQFRLHT
jgi:hypothetical protein